ncbi:glycoside hydrolase family 43 protein [Naasia lichenicola]|uniref:Glycoside hydrolase family 43 protein n=1 Tax=Naasia lichenicola TaxID=2565933 RepID=A0A4S4FGN7_9MICO|nr:glycoside hydrolase family 43 protein [Naasia lichenicola]THG29393.1 glycoside hydrolase family 43 protein [Naasia lichenicola]
MKLVNPLVAGFNPDPSIVLVDGVYYLSTSTFEYVPGLPIYRSTDLESFELIGHVITRPEQGGLEDVPTGLGVWAPTIRHRDGVFYLIITIAATRGCVLFTATDPAGPWSDGIELAGIEGIDPDLAWDEEGVALVTYSGLITSGPDVGTHLGIRQVAVDLETGENLEEPRSIWSGVGGQFPEAPHLYHRGEWWYLMIAEGGTERGHGESMARSENARGPFVAGPANPFISARSTQRPIQNTGHGDLVETPDGGTAMVLLGVRPRGGTRAFSALGRETFITSVTWEDGWPVAEPVQLAPREAVSYEVDFAEPLDGGWIAVRRTPAAITDLESVPGSLTLAGEGRDLEDAHPTFLGRRQEHQTASFASTVTLAEGSSGGLAVRYDEQAVYSLLASRTDGRTTITARAWIPTLQQSWSIETASEAVELKIASVPGGAGFSADAMTSDFVELIAVLDGEERTLARVDGRSLSAETAASFTGRVIGLFAVTGSVSFDGFRYTASND